MVAVKKIIFPCTAQVHEARQKKLIEELRKHFIVDIFKPKTKHKSDLETYTILCSVEFKNFMAGKHYDAGLVRADRLELLPLSSILAYRKIPIVHIEGGADSGANVIDTRVRNAISQLADIHLVTDIFAKRRVQGLGMDNVYDVGSLDVSFAADVLKKKPKRLIEEDYILLLHHSIPGEDSQTVLEATEQLGMKVVGVRSNADYSKPLMNEEYAPEDFISLIHHAKAFVGNSSALCKESSVTGVPAVLTGGRQDGRVVGWNVLRVAHDKKEIKRAIEWQIEHGRFKRDDIYYRPKTEQTICKILKKHL